MLFHSLAYAALLSSTFACCLFLPVHRRWIVLLLASGAFYWAWRVEYLGLLLITAVSCHYGALWIDNASTSQSFRRTTLFFVIAVNLLVLFLFKYYGLFVGTLNQLSGGSLSTDLGFLLPVGISFYTFQSIGYVVDVYQGKLPAERSLPRTTLFVAFFPQLVAGPIERARHLMPALNAPINFRWRNVRSGCWLILWGLFKKVVIADRLSLLVDHAYANPSEMTGGLLLLATYAFAFQIYCDFSGYTDMAIGSARLFGIDLMRNFRAPYLATGLRDFWARWHISLSTWFRDYVYIPLGGNRVSKVRWAFNIVFVFALSGLWHGAQWTFVVWGLIHGLGVLLEFLFGRTVAAKRLANQRSPIWLWAKRIFTFHVVLLAWVFFRAETFTDATLVLASFVDASLFSATLPAEFSRFELTIALVCLVWMFAIEHPHDGDARLLLGTRPRLTRRLGVLATLLLVLNFGIFSHPTQFVYFQF